MMNRRIAQVLRLSGMSSFALGAFLALGAAVPAAAAPTLSGGTVSGQAGTTVTIPVTFNPGTDQVASIQFDFTLPSALTAVSVTTGPVANAAGKSISASVNGQTWRVVVFGLNQTAIGSGTLLTARVTIAAGTAVGNLSMPISNVIYANPSGLSVPAGANTAATVTVVLPPPVITSTGTATGQVGTAFSYSITATNSPTSFNATGLPAGLSVNTTSGLISGTPTAAGTSNVTLSAINSGGTGTKTLSLTILPLPPVISSTGTATGQVGTAFTYQITATNSPTSYGATGLPAGLSINTTTGLIAGTPTVAVASTVTLSATNSGGTGTKILSLTVLPATPVITSVGSASGLADVAFTYQITATNSPTSFGATGLPSGLSVNSTTGLISGTPTATATSNVTLSAANAGGAGTKTLTLSVRSACDLNTDGSTDALDLQLMVNRVLGVAQCTSDINQDGLCTVIDIQRIVNAIMGQGCRVN